MPHKVNEPRRHKFPMVRHRVENWVAYDAALRRRGDLTIWVTTEAIAAWTPPATGWGGRLACYSGIAIETGLMLRLSFGRPWRQTKGLLGSLLRLLGLALPVPAHSTIARRARTVTLPEAPRSSGGPIHLLVDSTGLKLCGPGERLIEKHGTKKRRSWKRLHVGMDAASGQIVAATLTDRDVDDAAQVALLLDQVPGSGSSLTGDGAYDRTRVYAVV